MYSFECSVLHTRDIFKIEESTKSKRSIKLKNTCQKRIKILKFMGSTMVLIGSFNFLANIKCNNTIVYFKLTAMRIEPLGAIYI